MSSVFCIFFREHEQSFQIKSNRLHEGVELVFADSAVSRSFGAVGENPFVRRLQSTIPLVQIKVFTLHVIFFNGAEVEIICLGNSLNIFVAVAFIGINSSLFWSDVFESF